MKQHDFTQGGLWRQLVVFSMPIMATNLLQVSYQFVDSLWVGNLIGASALGAVAVSSVVIFTILSFIIGLNNAALTLLSQQKGRKDEAGLARYLNAFVVLMTVLSAALGLLGYVGADSLLRLLGTPPDMLQEARVYLQINCLGIWFLFGYNFIGTVMRSLGDSRTPLHFVIAAVVLNAVLDPLFIAGFGWGVQGAAAATIVSQGLAFLYGLGIVLGRRLAPFTWPRLPARQEVVLILKLGIPAGLQMSVISAGAAAIMSVVTSFGDQVVAGFSAAQRLDSIIMLPAQALGTAVNSMAGQNIGIRRWHRVSQIARYGVLYNLLLMVAIAVLIFLAAEWAVALFIQEPDAVRFGTDYLRVICWFYPFLGINFILNGIVRASGAMYQVLVLNLTSFWILRFPLAYLCSALWGSHGIALGMGISLVVSSLIASAYYRYGGWKRRRLFRNEAETD